MNNLKQFKKQMVLGQQMEMLTFNGTTPPDRLRGVREIVKVQTNGFYLAPFEGSKATSWFDFPKAADLEFHNGSGKHFTVKDRTKTGDVFVTREYLLTN